MAKKILNDDVDFVEQRNKINENFTELYTADGQNVKKETGKSLLADTEIARLLTLNNSGGAMTNAQVKAAYEANTNTNVFTDAQKTIVNSTTANLGNKVDKVAGKSLISDSEITRLAGVSNQDVSNKVDKVTGKSLLADTEIARLLTLNNSGGAMTNAQVKAAYEANTNTNVFTDAQKTIVNSTTTDLGNKVDKVAGKSLLADTEIARLLTLTNGGGAGAPMADWSGTAHVANTDIYHDGTVWRTTVATLATEEPGVSKKWVPKTGVVNGKISHVFLEETDYISSFENYSFKYTSNQASYNIMFSKDSEKSWVTWTNPYGPIVSCHIFTNGEIMFCTVNKVFHTRDFVTVTQGVVLDHDGLPYAQTAFMSFFKATSANNQYIFVDGVEMAVWSDYANNDPNWNARIWYTTDFGRTLKCALKFGTTLDKTGQSTSVRHSHGTNYNKFNGRFYSNTGDSGTQCKVLVHDYNVKTDTWTHEVLGSGQNLKFGNMFFDSVFTYVTTDYTQGGKKGMLKVKTTDMGDWSKYEYYIVVDVDVTNAGLIGFIEDTNGNKIITGDLYCVGKFYYAFGTNQFQPVTHNYPSNPIAPPSGFSANGDCYVMKQPPTSGTPTLRNPFFNLSKAMRKAGVYNFGRNPSLHNKDYSPLLLKDISSVTEQRMNEQIKFWKGTFAEYNALPNKDDNTLYIYPKP